MESHILSKVSHKIIDSGIRLKSFSHIRLIFIDEPHREKTCSGFLN